MNSIKIRPFIKYANLLHGIYVDKITEYCQQSNKSQIDCILDRVDVELASAFMNLINPIFYEIKLNVALNDIQLTSDYRLRLYVQILMEQKTS